MTLQTPINTMSSSVTINGITQKLINRILDRTYEDFKNEDYVSGVYNLCIRLGKLLQTHGSTSFQDWIKDYCLTHPVNEYLMQSPFTKRCFNKPKGYAGDATLIDYIYRIGDLQEEYSTAGKKIHDACIMSSCCDSVRWRAEHLGSEIDKMFEHKGRKISALSIASGHLRELSYVNNFTSKIENFVGLDQDEDSNEVARKSYPYSNLYIFDESIRYVLSKKLHEQSFDLVYSTGLFDYLEDKLSARMTARMFDLVAPGGSMIIPNFAKGMPEQGYMEAFMDWYLIYRDENQLFDFMSEINMNEIASYDIYSDPTGNVLYLKVIKKK
jgi:extracellular factor (EF) 3-hydroxypalmitic acid methyl ester biosynthesis protein